MPLSGGLVAGAVGVGALATAGAGGDTVTTCPPTDNSFYCKFVKDFNMFKMVLFMLLIIGVIVFLIYYFMKSSKKRK